MKPTNKITCIAFGISLSLVSHAEITMVGGSPIEGFLGSNKSQVTTTHVGTTQVSFDATGADKLVVVYAAESGFNTQSVTNLTMSFNGVPMTLAKFQQFLPPPALTNDNGAVAIFYLDNPPQQAATFTAGFTATGGGANGGHITIYGLAGTAPGIGAVAGTSTNARSGSPNVSTSITTSGANSLVIAGIQNSGANNISGAIPNVVSPLTLGKAASWGSNWGHGASGYQAVPGIGTTITPTFSTGTGVYVDVVAVEFTEPVPTQYWDRNDTAAGAGNPADGTWDASAANWNPLADGTGAVAGWSAGQKAIFAAGADATDPYTVTVDGSQNISGITFENGAPTLANGTSGALNLTADSAFNVSAAITATVATPVTEDSAGRQLVKIGSGTLAMSGNNAYTGATLVSQGTLILSGNNASATGGMSLNGGLTQFESPAAINGTGENVSVNAGATLLFGASFGDTNIPAALDRIVTTSAGVIAADNFDATNLNFATPALSAAFLGAVGNVAYTGTLTPGGTTYRLGGGGGTLTLPNTNAITGSGNALIVNGKVTLAGSNDYDGGTTLSSGLLALGNDGALGGGALSLNSGELSSDNSTSRSLANAATFNGNLGLGNAVNNGKLTFAGTVDLGGATRSLTLASDAEFSNVVSNGGLTKLGQGVLTLSGNNTYTGATTLNEGTLVLSGTSATSGVTANAGTLVIANAGGLGSGTLGLALANVQAVGTIVTTNPVSWTNTFTLSGTGELTLGLMTPNGNRQMTNNNTANTTTIAGINGANRNLTFAGNGNTTIGAITTGTGTLTKNNAGVLTLTGANTYSGVTTVNAGTLQLGDGTASNDGTISGNIVNNASLVFNRFGSATHGGVISGSGTVTKTGPGTQILTGANTYTGGTTVTAGTLKAASSSLTGAVSVESGATLSLGGGSFANALTLPAGSILAGAGTLAAPGDTIAFNVSPGDGAATGTIAFTNTTLTFEGTCAFDIGGTAPGSFDVVASDGAMTASGIVNVAFVNDFVPAAGQSWDLFAEDTTFASTATLNLPTLPGGLAWNTSNFATTGQISVVAGGGDPVEAYAATFGLTGNDALPGADPDGDGISNAIEYALGISPAANNGPEYRGVATTTPAGLLEFKFRRPNTPPPGVSYGLEFKTSDLDVGVWTAGVLNTDYTETFVDNLDGTRTVTFSLSGAVSGRKFARLKVTY